MGIEAHAGRPEIPVDIQHDTGSSLLMLAFALKILHHADDPAAVSVDVEDMPYRAARVRKIQPLDKRFVDHYSQDAVYPLSPGDGITRQHMQSEHPDIMFVDKFYLGDVLALNPAVRILKIGCVAHVWRSAGGKADIGYPRHSAQLLPQYLPVRGVGQAELDHKVFVETQIAVLKEIHLPGYDDRTDDHQLRNAELQDDQTPAQGKAAPGGRRLSLQRNDRLKGRLDEGRIKPGDYDNEYSKRTKQK